MTISASGNLRGTFKLVGIGQHKYEAVGAPIEIAVQINVDSGKVKSADLSVGE